MNRVILQNICFILCLLSNNVIASSFGNGVAVGIINGNIHRQLDKSHKKHVDNTIKCDAPNPNPFAPENLRDNTKCYPKAPLSTQAYIAIFVMLYIWASLILWIIKKILFGDQEEQEYIWGIILGNIIDSLCNDD